jgi:tRNA pseudouridine55 synthase
MEDAKPLIEGIILNMNKPAGWSSFDVVKKIRNISRIKKTGHAGTLDPFATGVLLVALGAATKKISSMMDLEKEYVGEIELGIDTDTLDITGKVTEELPTKHISAAEVANVCAKFIGEIDQVPPKYSAIQINGVRAYHLARNGEKVDLKPRKVKIFEFEVLSFENPFLKVRVRCSKGTYIRALARDIGKMLGTGGYLKTLERTRIGSYRIEDSLSISDFEKMVKNQQPGPLFKLV